MTVAIQNIRPIAHQLSNAAILQLYRVPNHFVCSACAKQQKNADSLRRFARFRCLFMQQALAPKRALTHSMAVPYH